jgi:hypothetical protein
MKPLTIAMAAALLATSGTAAAQSGTDIGCLLISNAFAKNAKDPNAQKAAEAAAYFYLGRIGDRTTPAQLKTMFESQSKTIDDKTAGSMMNACVAAIETKVKLVQSLSPAAPQQPPKGK